MMNFNFRNIKYVVCSVLLFSSAASALQGFSDPEAWSATIANRTNVHFNKEYQDDRRVFHVGPAKSQNIIRRVIKGKFYKVFRKRHGLAHGERQGFLAVDIINAFKQAHDNNRAFTTAKAREFMDWALDKLNTDQYFLQKLELVASFQRTGRQSEAGGGDYPELYKRYERSDAANFQAFAKKYVGPNSLFQNWQELQVYKEGLLHATADEGKIDPKKNADLRHIRDLLQITHELDLRRVPSFDPDTISSVVSKILFGTDNPKHQEERIFINKLAARADEYIAATGDRNAASKKFGFSDSFFILSSRPELLTKVLHETRRKSKIVF